MDNVQLLKLSLNPSFDKGMTDLEVIMRIDGVPHRGIVIIPQGMPVTPGMIKEIQKKVNWKPAPDTFNGRWLLQLPELYK